MKNGRLLWGLTTGAAGLALFLAFRYLVLAWPVTAIFRGHVTIPAGVSASRVAGLLKERQLISNESMFVNAVRVKFGTRAIRAGNFQLLNVRHMGDLTEQILRPRVRAVTLTIPEGLTRRQIARFIELKYVISSSHFLELTEDSAFISTLGLDAATLEGYLYPETYQLRNGMTEEDILTAMVRQAQEMLTQDITERGQAFGFNPHEILTMASIIEGEARYDSERVIISAVYHNRLRKRMRLQADPTVQYAIPDGPRRLLYRDYEFPSPYNTYLHSGLPPGPVNNPGLASILAAVSPAKVEYLYFVANDQGRHIFTTNLEEHDRVVQELRKPN